ncbi:transglutaminaseTgpA domain-containing protein [Herbiconiux sp. KACC 21604]|uniref:transglutaminase family protein n=1 Tax=unclassified Herbiconiux TaxID=2618217 RepID=UPI001491CACD|nr:transglutaminase domain-containing protein [Herbiconiux sp. SALV-R1]QJU55580.1 transglutaminase domain-containing protein [Herbiconiux sp. SALV-R1]WPO86773.1 transglutaminaseTgpA domain-containing protein [Herbiconiux sp. KACC 21604]
MTTPESSRRAARAAARSAARGAGAGAPRPAGAAASGASGAPAASGARTGTPLLPPRPNPGRPTWAIALDCGVVAALLLVSVLSFGPAYGGVGYLVAGIGGIVLGIAIGLAGWRMRWNLVVVAAVTILVYLVLGGPLAAPTTTILGVIPTLDTFRTLVLGVVFSWKDVLTLVTPLGGFESVLIVPFLTSLLAAVLATSFALRLTRFAWALLPMVALFVTAIAFGTREGAFPVAQGLAFVGIALGWAAWRRQEARAAASADTTLAGSASVADPQTAAKLRRTRLATAAGLVVAALGIGFATGGLLVPAAAREVLRDQIEPPLDLHDYASPLVGFRSYVRDKVDDSLFTVKGLPDGARIRLATLDTYDGTVYNVAGDGSSGSGSFVRVSPDIANDVEGDPATLEVAITGLTGVWLPDTGYLDGLTFSGERATQLEGALHYNRATGVALDTAGIGEGDTYTIDTVLPPSFNDEQLSSRQVSDIGMPRASGVPDVVSSLASEYAGDAETPIQQVRNIANALSQDGFFSHGLEGEAVSRAGHGAERIASLLDAEQMVGDDEQYAVAMALMVRSLGMPARVVMGFYPDQYEGADAVQDFTGDELHAWVEVPFDGAGWITFDPTPPEDQIPLEEAPKPKSDPKAQVLQPPPPPQEPAELPPDIRTEDTAQEEVQEEGFDFLPLFLVGGGVLGLLVVVLGPLLVIVLIKLARRRRRRQAPRPADRVSGGWDEIVDRAGDLGTRVPAGATRRDNALVLAGAYPSVPVVEVARRADGSVFGPGDPSPEEIDQYWTEVDLVVHNMAKSASWWKRFAARWSLGSFFHRRTRSTTSTTSTTRGDR